MELVSPVVGIIKSSWIPLKKHVGYLKHFQENVKYLSDQAEDLKARRMYLENVVRYFQEDEPIRLIGQWTEKAIEMEKEANKIEQKAKGMTKCLFCPNPICLYCISKQAKEEADIIEQHRLVGEFEKLTMPSLTPAVIEEPAPSIKGLSSVESTLKNVMDALDKENNRIIGVWGMGGIGKTTVVKNLNNQLLGTQHFSKVIVVVVSKDVDINRVQDDIARRLGLTLRNDSLRASELSSRLKQEKKFLIILDDLWDRLDLYAVGIPSGDSLKDSKIILTTRKESVCRRMQTQANIKVDVLQDGESWKLFKETASLDAIDDPDVQNTARNVLKECAGLPLAIITVGRALRGCRDSKVWDHALAQLREPTPDDIEDMEAKVYIPIKLSYELLRPELKPGFLFCCLYPDDYDIEIDRMIKQWMGEGFLKDAEDLEKTLNKGHSWVVELKASCLLLEGREEGFVRMHDVVRDVGIFIASKDEDYKSLVKTTADLKRLPRERWDEYKRISLMRSTFKELLETASCRRLLTLMLPENTELEIIHAFSEGGGTLRVLDLSNTAISQVPPLLLDAVNLRVLCLRRCRLLRWWDLSALGSLRQLECLDLSDNEGLEELPRVIGELGNLRSLDLTRTPNLAVLEKGILSRLTQLEELKMLQSFDNWGTFRSASKMASLSEVAHLMNLSRLFVEIRSVQDHALPFFGPFENVEIFCIRIDHPRSAKGSQPIANNLSRHSGACMEINDDMRGQRTLNALRNHLFRRTTGLALTDCHFFVGFPSAELFESLKYLSIIKCTGFSCVFKTELRSSSLDNLRHLELQDLPDLSEISREEEVLFRNLTDLRVSSCGELAHLFHFILLQTMKNLTTVMVDTCRKMETLFAGRLFDLELGRLQTLILSRLPSMRYIWETGSVVSLQNLTTLSISTCASLSNSVLSCSSLKGGLPNLVELSVVDCVRVKMIISEVTGNHVLLPKLRKLKLDDLPLLHSFCGGFGDEKATVDWHSLEEILVRRCPLLRQLEPLRGGRTGVPLLEKMEVEERWWDELDWGEDGSIIRSQFKPLFSQQ